MEKPSTLDMQHPEHRPLQTAVSPSLSGPGPHTGGAMPPSPQVLTAAFMNGETGQRRQSPFQPSSARQTFQVSGSQSYLQPSPMPSGGSATGETNAKKTSDLAKLCSPAAVVEALVVCGSGLSNNDIWGTFRKKYWTRMSNKSTLLDGKQGIQQWLAARIYSILPPSSAPGSVDFYDIFVVLFSNAESRRKAMQWLLSSGIELVSHTVSSQPDAFVDIRSIGRMPIPNPTRGMSIGTNSGKCSSSSSVPSIEGVGQGQLKRDLLPSRKPSPGEQHNPFQLQLPLETILGKRNTATEGGGNLNRRIDSITVFRPAKVAEMTTDSIEKLSPALIAADSSCVTPLQAKDSAVSVTPRAMIDVQSEMELHRSRVVAALGSHMNKSKRERSGRKKTSTVKKRSSLLATAPVVKNRPTSTVKATTPLVDVQKQPQKVLNEKLTSSLVTCRMTEALMAENSSSLIRTDAEKEAQAILVKMSKGVAEEDGGGGARLPCSASDDLEEGELSLDQPNPLNLVEAATAMGGSDTSDEIAKQRELVLIALKLSRSKSKLTINKDSDFSSTTPQGSGTEEAITIAKKVNSKSVTSSSVSTVRNKDNSTLSSGEGSASVCIGAGGGPSSRMSTDNTTKQLKEDTLKNPLQQKLNPSSRIVRLSKRVPSPAATGAFIYGRANNRMQKFVVCRSAHHVSGDRTDAEKYPYSIKGAFFGPDGMGVFPSGWANGHASSSVSSMVKKQKREMELRELQCKERALRLANIQGRIKRKEQELKDLQGDILRYDS